MLKVDAQSVKLAFVISESSLINASSSPNSVQQIEPVVGTASSNQPEILTGGLEYVPYGELYLDILQAATSKNQDRTFEYIYNGNR